MAKALLGQRLVHVTDGSRTAGLIVETEAYLGVEDKAAHSFGWRRTERTRSMFLDGGHAYVFMNYGIHSLVNVVVASPDDPKAVLIRALEPTHGLETMYRRRAKAKRDADLCSGPGKLCQALGIDRSIDGADLVSHDALFIERVRRRAVPASRIAVSARIGVDYAEEWADKPLRFHLRDHPHVSKR